MVENGSGDTPGAVVSPSWLTYVYQHYVLDLWVEQWRKKNARGDLIIVRYADDFVLGFQYRSDAERFVKDLQERLPSSDWLCTPINATDRVWAVCR